MGCISNSDDDLRVVVDHESGEGTPKLRHGPPDREELVRGLRYQEIEKFSDEQQAVQKWIRLRNLAYWCGTRDPNLSEPEREQRCSYALVSLLDSALDGEF